LWALAPAQLSSVLDYLQLELLALELQYQYSQVYQT
jgi:hypothetical protein